IEILDEVHRACSPPGAEAAVGRAAALDAPRLKRVAADAEILGGVGGGVRTGAHGGVRHGEPLRSKNDRGLRGTDIRRRVNALRRFRRDRPLVRARLLVPRGRAVSPAASWPLVPRPPCPTPTCLLSITPCGSTS